VEGKTKILVTFLFIQLLLVTCKEEASLLSVQLSKFTEENPIALFTDPSKIAAGKSDQTIINSIVHLINDTVSGGSIHISIYQFNHPDIIRALIRANNRNVEVNILLDWSRRHENDDERIKVRSLLENSGINVLPITNEIQPLTNQIGINHHKYLLINELKNGLENVVLHTSSNFITFSTSSIEDAIIMSNKNVYEAFLYNWTKLKESIDNSGVLSEIDFNPLISQEISVFFFPSTHFEEDFIVNRLKKITDPANTSISIAMSVWTIERSKIVDKLAELEENGANVKIAIKNNNNLNDELIHYLYEKLHLSSIKTIDLPDYNLHSKYMILDGEVDMEHERLVYTGSYNYSGSARDRNLETILRLNNSGLFDAYQENFESIWNNF
jgi:phosphatidylserine/phosphatidylglycerophosphate/cardiolipin synthase-like enzyme